MTTISPVPHEYTEWVTHHPGGWWSIHDDTPKDIREKLEEIFREKKLQTEAPEEPVPLLREIAKKYNVQQTKET